MNKKQTAKFASYNRIIAFLLAYTTTSFAGLTRLLLSATNFKAAFTALKLLLPTSTATKSSPTTITKNKDFSNLVDLMVSLANRAYLFAVDTASETLLATFAIEASSFKLAETEQISLAQNVLLALNNNSVALIAGYDIAATELTTAAADIILCQDQIAAPSTIIGNNKTFNDEIVAAFVLVDEKVELLGKSIYGKFKTGPFANTSIISNFEKARKPIESTNHTALDATINDINGNPIEGAKAEIAFDTETKEALANIEGLAEVEEFVSGTFNVTYSAAGYITQVIATKFDLGETTTVSIVLLKVV
jgi:hypothetical protein